MSAFHPKRTLAALEDWFAVRLVALWSKHLSYRTIIVPSGLDAIRRSDGKCVWQAGAPITLNVTLGNAPTVTREKRAAQSTSSTSPRGNPTKWRKWTDPRFHSVRVTGASRCPPRIASATHARVHAHARDISR